jgi:putative effector of murein hydrolase LrgA (UPF0299 family)
MICCSPLPCFVHDQTTAPATHVFVHTSTFIVSGVLVLVLLIRCRIVSAHWCAVEPRCCSCCIHSSKWHLSFLPAPVATIYMVYLSRMITAMYWHLQVACLCSTAQLIHTCSCSVSCVLHMSRARFSAQQRFKHYTTVLVRCDHGCANTRHGKLRKLPLHVT